MMVVNENVTRPRGRDLDELSEKRAAGRRLKGAVPLEVDAGVD